MPLHSLLVDIPGHLRGFFTHISSTWAGKTQTTGGKHLFFLMWSLYMVPAGWPSLGKKVPRLSIPKRNQQRGCLSVPNLTLEVTVSPPLHSVYPAITKAHPDERTGNRLHLFERRCQIMCGHVLKPLQSACMTQIIHIQHKPPTPSHPWRSLLGALNSAPGSCWDSPMAQR